MKYLILILVSVTFIGCEQRINFDTQTVCQKEYEAAGIKLGKCNQFNEKKDSFKTEECLLYEKHIYSEEEKIESTQCKTSIQETSCEDVG